MFINYYRIKVFPKEEVLWRELRKVVQSQEINASELDVETKFLRGSWKCIVWRNSYFSWFFNIANHKFYWYLLITITFPEEKLAPLYQIVKDTVDEY